MIHYDEWGRDPAYAAGAASFDVASLFVPGGVGLGAKAGGAAGHVGVAGARAGRLLEEAGTAGRWTGKLGELPAKASAAMNSVSVRAWVNTIRPALDNMAGALTRLDEGTATVRVADGVTAAGHGPFAGAADRLYSLVDRVDHSLHAGTKTTPLDPIREAPAPAGNPNTPVPHPAPDLGAPRELPGRAPEHQPVIGETDGGTGEWFEPGGRNHHGVPDQRFATGVTATGPKGYLLEYRIDYTDSVGKPKVVEFDGHLWRGHPPVEVFQEVKGNYDLVHRGVYNGQYLRDKAVPIAIGDWVDNTVSSQIKALEAKAPGSRLGWVFTQNEDLAKLLDKAVTRYLQRNPSTVLVDVKFIPMKG